MSNMCEDLLILEIFSRLPSKSLLRFRSVSKSLCARISSPGFIRLHALRSPKQLIIIHYLPCTTNARATNLYTLHSEGQLSDNNPYMGITPSNGTPFINFISIFGSCKGILCLCVDGSGTTLWNPSIRCKVRVRDHPSCRGFSGGVYGFGFDPILDDYKILRTCKAGTFVYTMKTRAWREVASPTGLFSFGKLRQCLFNGALYWPVKKHSSDECDESQCCVMTFDLSSEVFSSIELPKPGWEDHEVTIIKGSLAVISSTRDGRSRIWVRREDNNTDASWSLAFKFNKNAFKLNTNPFDGYYKVFQCSTNGDLAIQNYHRGFFVFNPETQVQLRLKNLRDDSCIVCIDVCVESLELLDISRSEL